MGYKGRGNKKTEGKLPNLESDIRKIVEPHSQVDPKFQSSLIYTRITPKAVRQALIDPLFRIGFTKPVDFIGIIAR